MHDKWYISENMLCHQEITLIHGYVFIFKQLTNLGESKLLSFALCFSGFLLANLNDVRYDYTSPFSVIMFHKESRFFKHKQKIPTVCDFWMRSSKKNIYLKVSSNFVQKSIGINFKWKLTGHVNERLYTAQQYKISV